MFHKVVQQRNRKGKSVIGCLIITLYCNFTRESASEKIENRLSLGNTAYLANIRLICSRDMLRGGGVHSCRNIIFAQLLNQSWPPIFVSRALKSPRDADDA